MDTARREILRAQRSAFMGLLQDGVISNEVFENMAAEIDASIMEGGEAFWFVPNDSLPKRLKARLGRVEVHEISIEDGSECAGKSVRAISWPQNCVIASVRRGEKMLIARGDTELLVNDVLMMIADDPALEIVHALAKGG